MQVVCILQASKWKKQTRSVVRKRTYSNLSSLCLHRTTIYHLDKKKSVTLRPHNYIAIILSATSRVLEIPFCRYTTAEQKFPGGVIYVLLFLYWQEPNWLFMLKPFFMGLWHTHRFFFSFLSHLSSRAEIQLAWRQGLGIEGKALMN